MNPLEPGTRKRIAPAPIAFFTFGLLLSAAGVAHAETLRCLVPAQWSDLVASADALPSGSSMPEGEHAVATLLGYQPRYPLSQAVLSHWLAQMKDGELACTLTAPSGSPYRLFADFTLKIAATGGRVLDGFAILAHKLFLLDTLAIFENLRPAPAHKRPSQTSTSRGAELSLPVRSGLLARLLLDDTLKRTSGPGTTRPIIKRETAELIKGDRTTPRHPAPLTMIERIKSLADTAPIERLVRGQISAAELLEVFLQLNTAEESSVQKSEPALRQSTVDLLDAYTLLKTAFVTNALSSPYQKRLIFGLEASESSPHLTFSSPHVASFEARLLEALAKEGSEKPQFNPHQGEKTGHP